MGSATGLETARGPGRDGGAPLRLNGDGKMADEIAQLIQRPVGSASIRAPGFTFEGCPGEGYQGDSGPPVPGWILVKSHKRAEPSAGVETSARVLRRLQRSWAAVLALRLADAHDHITAVEWEVSELSFEKAAHLHAELNLIRGAIHAIRDEPAASLAVARRGLAEPGLHGVVATALCRLAYWRQRDFEGLRQLPVARMPAAGTRRGVLPAVLDLSVEAAVAFEELRFPLAKRLAWDALYVAEKAFGRNTPVAGLAAATAAHLALEEGRLEEAERLVSERVTGIRAQGDIESAIRVYDVLARVAHAAGRQVVAARVLEDGAALGDRRNWPRLVAGCTLTKLELLLQQRRLDEANQCVVRLDQLASYPAAGDHVAHDDLRRVSLQGRAQFERVAAPSQRVAAVYRHLKGDALARRDLRQAVQHTVSLAGLLAELGDWENALTTLAEVTAFGASVGLFHTLAQGGASVQALLLDLSAQDTRMETRLYIQTLLTQDHADALARNYGRRAARNESPISEREESILRLVSEGLVNKRIAQALGISPETVKSHIKNIFAKLSVATRAEAVRRARTLGLI
ncbi:MAG: response regulator transcription factor [Caulobacteraceae bacterium]